MPSQEGAIGQLRILEPCKELGEQGYATTTVLNKEAQVKTEEMIELIKKTDIFWYQSVMNQKMMWNFLNVRQINPNAKLVIDIDDNLYCVNSCNPCYTSFTRDEKIEGKDFFIKLPKGRNHARIRMFETMMRESDAVITTTELLAAAYSHLNKNIYVMPNRLIFSRWDFSHIPIRQDGKIRISWMGGTSHMMDWSVVHAPLKRVLNSHENVLIQFHTNPESYIDYIRDFGKEKCELHEWIDYSGHSFRMNCTKPDIAVIPLHEDEFSICKSDLKFSEYATLRLPCVASNIPPYSKSIIHGKTGFLASNEDEFEKYLNMLVKSPELRKEIGDNAYEWAKENRCLEKGIIETKDILEDIMKIPKWHISPKIIEKQEQNVLI